MFCFFVCFFYQKAVKIKGFELFQSKLQFGMKDQEGVKIFLGNLMLSSGALIRNKLQKEHLKDIPIKVTSDALEIFCDQ